MKQLLQDAKNWCDEEADLKLKKQICYAFSGIFAFVLLGAVFGKSETSQGKTNIRAAQRTTASSNGSCSADQARVAQSYIQAWGYSCDEVSSCIPFVMSRGARINCSLKYTYYLEDKGGNWVVTLQ